MRGCFGISRCVRADQHQVHAVRVHHRIAFEVREQFLAALVLVDSPDVHRKGPLQPELLPESPGLRPLRNLRSHADHDARTLTAAHMLEQRTLLERVVHHRAGAAEHRLEHLQPDGRIALRGRHEHRLGGHGPHAVPRVVVAIAEEDEEVERRLFSRRCRMRAGLVGPSLSSQRSSSASECVRSNTRCESRPNSSVRRGRDTGNRLTLMPLTFSSPAGSSFFQVM